MLINEVGKVQEIMSREVSENKNCCTCTDYQMRIKNGKNL
jgi:hypothetical protein